MKRLPRKLSIPARTVIPALAQVRGGAESSATPDTDADYVGDKNPGEWKGQN
jgi:hypothetical protein